MANGDSRTWKMFEIAMAALLSISIALAGWALRSAADHETRISVIEANRFNAQDGTELIRQMIDMERSIRADMPPQQWRDRIIRLEVCQANLERNRSC